MVSWMLSTVALANPYAPTVPLAPSVDAPPFRWIVPERAVDVVEVVLTVPAEHLVYRDMLGIRAVEGTIDTPVFPEARLRPDLYDPGEWRASFDADVRVKVPVKAVGATGQVVLELTQQGCRAGLCWPIVTTRHPVAVTLTPKKESTPP
jgi:hypothetical protein